MMMIREMRRLADEIIADTLHKECPQQITTGLSASAGSLVFVIDHSGSMASACGNLTRLEAAIKATAACIAVRARISPADFVAAVVFDDAATVISRCVSIEQAERALLRPLRRVIPNGGTDTSCGLSAAESIIALSPPNLARHIVLLGDGADGGSPYDISDRMKASGIVIDAIGVGASREEVDEACLKRIASEINGVLHYKFLSDAEQLVEHFETIAYGLTKVNP